MPNVSAAVEATSELAGRLISGIASRVGYHSGTLVLFHHPLIGTMSSNQPEISTGNFAWRSTRTQWYPSFEVFGQKPSIQHEAVGRGLFAKGVRRWTICRKALWVRRRARENVEWKSHIYSRIWTYTAVASTSEQTIEKTFFFLCPLLQRLQKNTFLTVSSSFFGVEDVIR